MANVTVVGTPAGPVSLPFTNAEQAVIAQQLATAINAGVAAGTLAPKQAAGIGAPTLPAGTSGELVIQKGGLEVLSPGYVAVVADASGITLLGDGQTNQSVLAGTGGLTYITNGGSGTIVAGGGDNRIVTSGVGWNVSTGGGNDTLVASSGAVTLSAGGGQNAIQLGSGTALVDTTGRDQIQGGTGAATVNVQLGAHAFYTGGAGTLLFIDTGAGSTVVGGSGAETIFGANGSYTGGTSGNNLIYGSGTLTGGGGGDTLSATGQQATLLQAAAGNETLSAALSTGADTLVAGPGADTLFGGAGKDVFEFNAATGGGSILVQDFTAADSVHLGGYIDNPVTSVSGGAAGTTLQLSDKTTITFAGVTDPTKLHFS